MKAPSHRSQVFFNGGFQLVDAAVRPATNLLFSQGCKPAFHQVDPRCTGRREVYVKAWPLGEPAVDRRSLMGPVIVHNQVHVQPFRHGLFDRIEELPEFGAAMPTMAFANDLAPRRPLLLAPGHLAS